MTAQEKCERMSNMIITAANDSKDFTEWESQDYEALLQDLLAVVNE